MNEYGVFANIVAIAGSLAAAAGALRLAWMKRSNWQPPEESVPDAVGKFASLFAMIIIGFLYAFAESLLGLRGLAWLSFVCFLLALVFLATTIFVNVNYTFESNRDGEVIRVLGGKHLTTEAAEIASDKNQTEQQMFEDGQWDKDLIWTRKSQATFQIVSTISFIGLISFGTTAVAAISNLIALTAK